MTFDPSLGDGAQILDVLVQQQSLAGYSLVDSSSDCEVTAGTNDLTVDVSSGTARLGGPFESISGSTNVDLPTADASNPRKALVYLDNNGDVQTEGGPAVAADPSGETHESTHDPQIPIPSEDYLPLAAVWIPAGATDITDSDIWDLRSPSQLQLVPSMSMGPVLNDEQVFSTDSTESGLVYAQSIEIESGVTITADGWLLLVSPGEIIVDGTINGVGQGASGGTGETDPNGNGGRGGDGSFAPIGSGGTGGDSGGQNEKGGDGGDGDTRTTTRRTLVDNGLAMLDMAEQFEIGNPFTGAGGGGGAAGEVSSVNAVGDNGSAPGGGGGGALVSESNGGTPGNGAGGGDGGDGGAGVVLIAPQINGNGTIDTSATDGQNGQDGDAGGGGGGGGSGGANILIGDTEPTGMTRTANAGVGGIGGTSSVDNVAAGDGANGEDGPIKEVTF